MWILVQQDIPSSPQRQFGVIHTPSKHLYLAKQTVELLRSIPLQCQNSKKSLVFLILHTMFMYSHMCMQDRPYGPAFAKKLLRAAHDELIYSRV
jgi:hypothetical protein